MNNKPKFVYFETTTVKLSKILCKHLQKKDKIWKIIIRLWHNLRWALRIPDCYWHNILQFKEKNFFLCHVELFCKFSRSFFRLCHQTNILFFMLWMREIVTDRIPLCVVLLSSLLISFSRSPSYSKNEIPKPARKF